MTFKRHLIRLQTNMAKMSCLTFKGFPDETYDKIIINLKIFIKTLNNECKCI